MCYWHETAWNRRCLTIPSVARGRRIPEPSQVPNPRLPPVRPSREVASSGARRNVLLLRSALLVGLIAQTDVGKEVKDLALDRSAQLAACAGIMVWKVSVVREK